MGWIMDVASVAGVPLARGIPMITGGDLLGQLKHLNIGNGGSFHVQTDFLADAVPTFANLGINRHLFFAKT